MILAEPNLAYLADLPVMWMARTTADLALRPSAEKIDAVLATIPECSRICLDLERVNPANDDGQGIYPGGVWNPTNARTLTSAQIQVCVDWYKRILTPARQKYPETRWYTYGGPFAIPENYLFWQLLGDANDLWSGGYSVVSFNSLTNGLDDLRQYVRKVTTSLYGGLYSDSDIVVGLFPCENTPRWWWEAVNDATQQFTRHMIVQPYEDARSCVEKVQAVL